MPKFAVGNTARLGIPNPNAGRKPDWLKARCQELVEEAKVVEFLASVVKGEDVEQAVGDQGEALRLPAAVRDRLKAAEMLLDRGYGKPGQPLDVTVARSELDDVPTRALLDVIAALPGGTTGPDRSGTGKEATH